MTEYVFVLRKPSLRFGASLRSKEKRARRAFPWRLDWLLIFHSHFRRPGNEFLFSRDERSRHVPSFLSEPEKLQIIQQYLKSSRLTGQNVTSGEPITPTTPHDEPDPTANVTGLTPTTIRDAFATPGDPLSGGPSFPGGTSPPGGAGAASRSVDNNATRYCDDCVGGEVCVALADEEVPTCRSPRERDDPTGCAGFCVVSKQKCHRLDVDAFRYVLAPHL